MKVYRMQFDIAVERGNDVPDVHDLETQIIRAISKVPHVVGAEGAAMNSYIVNCVDVDDLIGKKENGVK